MPPLQRIKATPTDNTAERDENPRRNKKQRKPTREIQAVWHGGIDETGYPDCETASKRERGKRQLQNWSDFKCRWLSDATWTAGRFLLNKAGRPVSCGPVTWGETVPSAYEIWTMPTEWKVKFCPDVIHCVSQCHYVIYSSHPRLLIFVPCSLSHRSFWSLWSHYKWSGGGNFWSGELSNSVFFSFFCYRAASCFNRL